MILLYILLLSSGILVMGSIETRQSIGYNCILLSFYTLNIFFDLINPCLTKKRISRWGKEWGNPPTTQCPWQGTLSQDERSQEPLRKTI